MKTRLINQSGYFLLLNRIIIDIIPEIRINKKSKKIAYIDKIRLKIGKLLVIFFFQNDKFLI